VRARIVVAKPHEAMLALIPHFYRPVPRTPGVHAAAVVGPEAVLGRDVCIEAGAVIGARAQIGDRCWIGANTVVGEGVRIGDDGQLYPQVTVYPHCELGKRVTLHAGVRIGSDGFGYVSRKVDGRFVHEKIPHVGRAIVGDDVEILGAGAKVGAQAGVISDVPAGESWSGYPARPHKESLRASAALFKLAGMLKKIERLLDKADA